MPRQGAGRLQARPPTAVRTMCPVIRSRLCPLRRLRNGPAPTITRGELMPELNVLLASGGWRPYLTRWFKEALKLNGVAGQVIVADSDPRSPARAIADCFVTAPRVGDPSYEDWLRDQLATFDVGLAISINDFELSEWSRLDAEDQGLEPLIRPNTTSQNSVEDKALMVSLLAEARLPVPPTHVASDGAPKQLGDDLVVKGRFGSGSRGLALCDRDCLPAALEHAIEQVTDRSGARPLTRSAALDSIVIQPRIRGQEFGLDVVSDLQSRFVTVLAREKIAMRGGETDQAITVDPSPFRDIAAGLADVLQHRGTIDVDVIQDRDGVIWVIDINPRFGGGYPFSHLAGANIPAAYVAWRTGQRVDEAWLAARPSVTSAKYVDIAVVSEAPSSETS